MRQLSICIPTYNRARLLRQCLAHLAGYADTGFELLVGDNASDDDTPAVVAEFAPRFPHFVPVRHATNVGYVRNMDTLLRRATRDFVYVLCDDDLAFEPALALAASVLQGSPGVSAVVGGYVSVRRLDPSLRVDVAGAVATVIARGSHAALLARTDLCDGHPVMRRDTYTRHCAYRERVNLVPLYFDLLDHGDLVSVDRPFFQHLTNADSLTSRMPEPWFLDVVNADLELAVAGRPGLPADALEDARRRLLPMMYFQAARMSANTCAYRQLWLFLRRYQAVSPGADDLLLACEQRFLHEVLVERLEALLADGGFDPVGCLPSPMVEAAVAALSPRLPATRFVALPAAEPPALVLCDRHEDGRATGVARVLALQDLLGQHRLTRHPAMLAAAGGRLVFVPESPAVRARAAAVPPALAALLAPYAEETGA